MVVGIAIEIGKSLWSHQEGEITVVSFGVLCLKIVKKSKA